MIYRNDPRQTLLFDRVEEILHPKAKARLDESWPGVFRCAILKLMPVEDIGKGFSPDFGRPTKEHYSICGLILLKDYFGWTNEKTIDKYLYDLQIRYALKLQPDCLELGVRTLARYLKLFRINELARKIMDDVTLMIIRELNIEVDKQRLDSTHVFSNMADWNRSMLLFRTTKRFMVQLKRHESKLYHELDKEFIDLYDCNGSWIYTDEKTRNVRLSNKKASNREQLGWDMLRLIERFEKHPKLSNMNTFKDMVRVFGEQCEIDDGKCPKLKQCSISKPGNNYAINYDERSLRLRERRFHEKTEEFREQYRPRSGEEGLFGRLKQTTPLRRLGVRGKSAVYNAISSIMAVHNIMQMASFYQKQTV